MQNVERTLGRVVCLSLGTWHCSLLTLHFLLNMADSHRTPRIGVSSGQPLIRHHRRAPALVLAVVFASQLEQRKRHFIDRVPIDGMVSLQGDAERKLVIVILVAAFLGQLRESGGFGGGDERRAILFIREVRKVIDRPRRRERIARLGQLLDDPQVEDLLHVLGFGVEDVGVVSPLPVLLLACNKTKLTDKDAVDSGPDETVDPYAGHDMGSWLSMKATPDGKPALAYYDHLDS